MSLSDDYRSDEEIKKDVKGNLVSLLALMPRIFSSNNPQDRRDISQAYLIAQKIASLENVNTLDYDLIALGIVSSFK